MFVAFDAVTNVFLSVLCVLLQCLLDKEGATDLVVDLIIGNYSNRTFHDTIELGIALLDGGNCAIQVTLHCCSMLIHRVHEKTVPLYTLP